jgi:hypothetical protein
MRDARVQLAADALPLELATLSGRAIYSAARRASRSPPRAALPPRLGRRGAARRFSIARTRRAGAAAVEVRADGIDLKIAATLLDYFPVPRELKGQVLRFAPRGRIARGASRGPTTAQGLRVKGASRTSA